MNGLHWFIWLGAFAGVAMFSVVFRRVRADLIAARNRGVPLAVVTHRRGAPSWTEGSLRTRLLASLPTVQASIVATAATSVLVMSLCLLACLVLVVLGR